MQTQPITPNTKPIAKTLKRVKSNLGKPADQLNIYRNVYKNYLLNEKQYEALTCFKLLKLFDHFFNTKNIDQIFSIHITIFHKSFIQKLSNL